MCVCVCVCVCVFRQYFFVEAYLIKCYFLSTHFYFDPFKSPFGYYIRLELVNKFSVINWIPSIFRPLLGYHHGDYILPKYNTMFYLYWCNFLKI